ncbi:hypothetical protein [Brevibacillus migulae]|uniref:hypothetical protein n=1 Tax=Brevibacillus migulae TaxID=1644114 RepID=UPI00106E47F2|nr:hypothetical protein [Brevibacillus migulae]
MNRFEQALQDKPFLLMVSLPQNDVELAKAAIAEGADGLKVHINVFHRASGNRFGPLSHYEEPFRAIRDLFEGPFGIVPGGSINEVNPTEAEQFASYGIDFTSIYGHHLSPALLKLSGVASTFAIHDQFDLNLLEVAKDFPMTALEASVIPGREYGTPLSFADLLKYRYLVKKAQIPVIVPTQRRVTPADIPVLRDTGIRGLLVGAVAMGKTADEIRRTIAAFRQAIDREE